VSCGLDKSCGWSSDNPSDFGHQILIMVILNSGDGRAVRYGNQGVVQLDRKSEFVDYPLDQLIEP